MAEEQAGSLFHLAPQRRPGAAFVELDPRPGARNRWQPTRAGAVNTWQWGDEQFVYVNGLLAMIGRNGCGKSLTSGVLCPTFMDGNITAKALSASGSAAGSLLAIHTQGRTGPPRTGMWWQEYGRTTLGPDGCEQTEWLTVGLWLRSSGGSRPTLDLAWFLVGGRADADLVMQRDGVPITVEDLAGQLLVCQGQLFTDAKALQHGCQTAGLTADTQEGFVEAVRRAMYEPLDRPQVDALSAILRVLRSVQANDKLSPESMQDTLTKALPPLETAKVRRLAESLSTADRLHGQLARARTEARLLGEVRDAHRRYAAAAAARAAAGYLTTADARDGVVAGAAELQRRRDAARTAQSESEACVQESDRQHQLLGQTVESLERGVQGHPGAGLAEWARAAEEAEERARHALRQAQRHEGEQQEARGSEERAHERAVRCREVLAHESQRTVRVALDLNGGALVDPMRAAEQLLESADGRPDADFEAGVRSARDHGTAWVQGQQEQVNAVREARVALDARREAYAGVQERYDAAQQARVETEERAHALARVADEAEETAGAALSRYVSGLLRLRAPGTDLLRAVPLDPQAVRAFFEDEGKRVRGELDVRGKEVQAEAAAEAMRTAQNASVAARHRADQAVSNARDQQAAFTATVARLTDPPSSFAVLVEQAALVVQDAEVPELAVRAPLSDALPDGDPAFALEERAQEAEGAMADLVHALRDAEGQLKEADAALTRAQGADGDAQQAAGAATAARSHADDLTARAARAGSTWADQVHAWASGLDVLDSRQLRLPDRERPAPDSATRLRGDVDRCYMAVAGALAQEQAQLTQQHTGQQAAITDLDVQIDLARHTEQGPGQPEWRPSRADRPGAPLWKLVSFARALTEEERGQLEGALLAVGLLDAWMSPDGTVTAGDLCLVPGTRAAGTTLARFLVPDTDAPVAGDRIQALLDSVGVGDLAAAASPGGRVVRADGTVNIGPLKAAAPPGWQARYIGAAARERSQRQRLAELARLRERATADLALTTAALGTVKERRGRCEQERVMPDPDPWQQHLALVGGAVDRAQHREELAQQARHAADASHARADAARQAAIGACRAAHVAPDASAVHASQTVCGELKPHLTGVVRDARAARDEACAAGAARREADDRAEQSEQAHTAWEQAQNGAAEVEQDLAGVPGELDALSPARTAVETARAVSADKARAAAQVEDELSRLNVLLRQDTAALHSAAHAGAVPLATDLHELEQRQHRLGGLTDALRSWADQATTTGAALSLATSAAAAAAGASARADQARAGAQAEAATAEAARHRYAEERRQHDTTYQALVDELLQARQRQVTLRDALAQHQRAAADAQVTVAVLTDRFDSESAAIAQATQKHDACLRTLRDLFDHHIVEELAGDGRLVRPADEEEAAAVARLILEQRGQSPDMESARAHEQSSRATVDSCIRRLLPDLLRIGLHVSCEDLADSGWRRVVVSQQLEGHGLSGARELRDALTTAGMAVTKLEHDFNEQVQSEVKGVVFSELRRAINVRIALAEKIVADIRRTLKGVRTSVERVGIKLSWAPEEGNPLAVKALHLIRDVDQDGSFDEMYDFFVAQLGAENGKHESWAKQVEHVFDYRAWHSWKIELTHKRFSDPATPDQEVFKTATGRSNPLSTLSAGEKRLVTMLPLLAAAHAFYSTHGYQGPRMIFIDELNAALDAPNLRMLLQLLRQWDFDAVFTLPSMQPLLVPEIGRIGIHRIQQHPDGNTRFTVPSIWTGTGSPRTALIRVPGQAGAPDAQ
ncbi:hypothetical protein GCM10010302_75380 [Streptomyces polychromogenes]|uniref:TIGR02680 family protein n=3 Tax=Streptomyces TaxID=1883 RepID=A0ABP3FVU3_9ACTN